MISVLKKGVSVGQKAVHHGCLEVLRLEHLSGHCEIWGCWTSSVFVSFQLNSFDILAQESGNVF